MNNSPESQGFSGERAGDIVDFARYAMPETATLGDVSFNG
jgi:hypothetical protein